MRKLSLFILGLFVFSLFLVGFTVIQNGYDLYWSTMDSGGVVSSGGTHTLSGSLGQPDTGAISGGDYTLASGFWHGVASSKSFQWVVRLPIILNNP